MTAPASAAGASPSSIRRASPSTMAVLPTPASPMNSGLFLRRRASTCSARSICGPRPMSGSISPARARSFRLTAYLASGSTGASSSSSSPVGAPPCPGMPVVFAGSSLEMPCEM